MEIVSGTYRGGRVELDLAVDWPEGSRVDVKPVEPPIGLTEEDWPDDAVGRTALLARMDALEPLEMTPEEEANLAEAREAVRRASTEAVRTRMGLKQ